MLIFTFLTILLLTEFYTQTHILIVWKGRCTLRIRMTAHGLLIAIAVYWQHLRYIMGHGKQFRVSYTHSRHPWYGSLDSANTQDIVLWSTYTQATQITLWWAKLSPCGCWIRALECNKFDSQVQSSICRPVVLFVAWFIAWVIPQFIAQLVAQLTNLKLDLQTCSSIYSSICSFLQSKINYNS